jgi:hypothetical protein
MNDNDGHHASLVSRWEGWALASKDDQLPGINVRLRLVVPLAWWRL